MARAKKTRPRARARLEFVDVATGEAQRPEPPGPEADGTAPTGRVVVELDGEEVEVDEEDLIGRGEGEHPRERSWELDEESPIDYSARAKAKAAARAKATTQRVAKPRAIRATFDSPAKAAAQFYDGNEGYFDNVRDPFDGLRDWMDGIEVGKRGRTRRLSQTPAGVRILGQGNAEIAIKQSIAYVFGKAEGRRWDNVDFREVERLDEALRPYYEAPVGERRQRAAQRGIYWRPVVGTATAEDLAALPTAQREQYRDWESAEEVRGALEDLREAYGRNLDCLAPKRRRIVQRRIQEWNRWARDPKAIPEYACEPDEQAGGYTCDYPSVAGELRELRAACERDYDPNWAEPEGRAGAPGFPDLSRGPPDPRVEAPAAAIEVEELAVSDLRQLADDGRAYGTREEAVVDREFYGGILYQLEYRTCGKRNPTTGRPWCWCFGAFPHGGHGPYWYAYYRDLQSGRRRSQYLGKTFREV